MDNVWWNATVNILRRRGILPAAQKLLRRLEPETSREARDWIALNGFTTTHDFCHRRNPALWKETELFGESFDREFSSPLQKLPKEIGGGGNHLLMYFLTRQNRPNFLIETGVAAGWTSHAILQAMMKNGFGHLFSSDLPYLRLKDAGSYVGILVPDRLRSCWTLDLRGDVRALPLFLRDIPKPQLSLFHYDSDKSHTSRARATRLVTPWLSSESILIMDDIQDNVFFRDLVTIKNLKFTIIEFKGKFLGVIENAGLQLSVAD